MVTGGVPGPLLVSAPSSQQQQQVSPVQAARALQLLLPPGQPVLPAVDLRQRGALRGLHVWPAPAQPRIMPGAASAGRPMVTRYKLSQFHSTQFLDLILCRDFNFNIILLVRPPQRAPLLLKQQLL